MPHPAHLILLLFLSAVSLLRAETLQGTCTHVVDGDTLVIRLSDESERTIRLYGIDAPELKQDFGKAAQAQLHSMTHGQRIHADVRSTDRYGRAVARLFVGSKDVCLSQVRDGFAWHYAHYAPQAVELAEAETLAAGQHIGLWQQPHPIPPWEYRRGARPAAPNPLNHPYWITENGKLHNAQCKYFGITQNGRYLPTPPETCSNCRLCGGASQASAPDSPAWWNLLLLALLLILLPADLIRLLIKRSKKAT